MPPVSLGYGSLTRRELLQQTACGFGMLALAGLCQQESRAARGADPMAPRAGHHRARAKRVIFIFMQGGPSHIDTFDYKPQLQKRSGQKLPMYSPRHMRRSKQTLLGSPWRFKQHGESGIWVSELFPHLARHVDKLCLLHSLHTNGVAHGPATLFLHTGATNLIRPSVGAWITYGLGSENRNLPGFVTISPPPTKGGPRNYSNAFLPAVYQATVIGRAGVPVAQAGVKHLRNPRWSRSQQRSQLDLLARWNRIQQQRTAGRDAELDAVIRSYELAFRMQMELPPLLDLSRETAETLRLYGIGQKETDDFGRQCLLARRLAEAGVRYIQINYASGLDNPPWDQHSKLKSGHEKHARAVDRPVAGLLEDLHRRGLLEDTLVWWGGEFGRTPFAQGRDGRDHNPQGFTMWLAGGGVREGFRFGATDEFGQRAVEQPVHMHDMHATLLYLLGLDHQRLTFTHHGRRFRLTDIHGNVVHEIFS